MTTFQMLIVAVTIVIVIGSICDMVTNCVKAMYEPEESCYDEEKGDEK